MRMFKHKARFSGLFLAALLLLGMLGGCANSAQSEGSSAPLVPSETGSEVESAAQSGAGEEASAFEGVQFTDALGHEVALAEMPQRVAVVMGSFAEVWLLAGGELAAATVDAWDDERSMPIGEETVDLGAMKSPSVEVMIAEGVDFVILSSKIEEHVALYDQLAEAGIQSAYFEVELFDDYLAMLKTCTDITGRADLYEQNGEAVRTQIDAAIARQEGHEAPTVLFIRAFSSGASAKGSDNMTGAMLKDLGCQNIADSEDSLLEDLSMEVIIEQDPDYIFYVTMGESEEKALESMRTLLEENPAFSGLSAVQNERYILLPKQLFHQKPNNRWGESYEYLADILYAEAA